MRGVSYKSSESSSDDEDSLEGDSDGASGGEVNPLLLDPTQWKVGGIICSQLFYTKGWSLLYYKYTHCTDTRDWYSLACQSGPRPVRLTYMYMSVDHKQQLHPLVKLSS